jgi:uncharacterized protein involved in exopolysaccharide biosynthesis
MTGAARESDQADFDLERFINLFDEAMTSRDPRVIETLRNLLMIVTLTRPETHNEQGRRSGPLRRLFEDMNDLNRSVHRMDAEIQRLNNTLSRVEQPYRWEAEDKYTMAGAAKMAQQIDHDVLNQLRQQQIQAAKVINGGMTLGPEKAVKGLK